MKTLENREKLYKIIGHALKLYMVCNGYHAISHNPNSLVFENNSFLHASGLNDKFGIRNCYRGEGICLIINIFLVPGHCLLLFSNDFSVIF